VETVTKEPETIEGEMAQIAEKIDIEGYTEQDHINKAATLNHYIQDRKQSGRAAITKVPKKVEVTPEFVKANISGVAEIMQVRKECSKCTVSDQSNCKYNTKKRKEAREVEDEQGLERGTITPDSYLFADFYWKSSGGHKKSVSYLSLVRPTLLYHNNKLLTGYEKCPIAQTEREARQGTY